MRKILYDKILESLGKTIEFPTKKDIKEINKFNEEMQNFNEKHKHNFGENIKLDCLTAPNLTKYLSKPSTTIRPYGNSF